MSVRCPHCGETFIPLRGLEQKVFGLLSICRRADSIEVHNRFPERSLKVVRQALYALVKKGFVMQTRDGRNFQYWPR